MSGCVRHMLATNFSKKFEVYEWKSVPWISMGADHDCLYICQGDTILRVIGDFSIVIYANKHGSFHLTLQLKRSFKDFLE